jgi:hypothetical protein
VKFYKKIPNNNHTIFYGDVLMNDGNKEKEEKLSIGDIHTF